MEQSVEGLVGRYFPKRTQEIHAYAQFLASAGIERGLIGPREGERIWDRTSLTACLSPNFSLKEPPSLISVQGLACLG